MDNLRYSAFGFLSVYLILRIELVKGKWFRFIVDWFLGDLINIGSSRLHF